MKAKYHLPVSLDKQKKSNVGKSKEKEAAPCPFDRRVSKVNLLGEKSVAICS